jgi:hypothetical protein
VRGCDTLPQPVLESTHSLAAIAKEPRLTLLEQLFPFHLQLYFHYYHPHAYNLNYNITAPSGFMEPNRIASTRSKPSGLSFKPTVLSCNLSSEVQLKHLQRFGNGYSASRASGSLLPSIRTASMIGRTSSIWLTTCRLLHPNHVTRWHVSHAFYNALPRPFTAHCLRVDEA